MFNCNRPLKKQAEKVLLQIHRLLAEQEAAARDSNAPGRPARYADERGARFRIQLDRVLHRLARAPGLRRRVIELESKRGAKPEQHVEQLLSAHEERCNKAGEPPVDRRARVERMLAGLRRNRAYRQKYDEARQEVEYLPVAQPAFTDGTNVAERAPIEHHDVLMIAPRGVHGSFEHYRFPVRKTNAADDVGGPAVNVEAAGARPAAAPPERVVGSYDQPPELMDVYDVGQRHTMAIARPQDWGHAGFRKTERGPAVSTIPIKPEPGASSCIACYLLNAQNLNYRNAWTAEEWNDVPDGPDLAPALNVNATSVEFLVAGPRGLVFRVDLRNLDRWEAGSTVELTLQGRERAIDGGSIRSVDLCDQSEVWQQLRNGCVMGRVLFDDGGPKRIVPLVNITTLTSE